MKLSGVCGASLFAMATVFVSPSANAQTAGAMEPQGDAQENADDDDNTIIVTARRREETLQEVPVAVTAFTGEQLADNGIDGLKALIQFTPGAMTADLGASFSDEIVLRGQGSGRNVNAEPATGIYRNGIFVAGGNIGGRNFNRMDLFDIERVETLRGPQGALFGRNAVGGAINLISKKPDFDFGGRIMASYGSYDRVEIQGAVDLPLSETFAVRAAGIFIDRNDGWFTDAITGEPVNQEDFAGGRLTARVDSGGPFSASASIEYFDESGPSFAVGTFNPTTTVDPYAANGFNFPSVFERDELTAFLELALEQPAFRIDAITLYKERDASTSDDVDAFLNLGNGQLPLTRVSSDDFSRWGQEVRISSLGSGPLTWLVGAEYSTVDDSFIVAANGRTSQSVSDDSSFAIFGSLGYDLSDALTATLEGRYTRDDKSIQITSQLSPAAPVTVRNFDADFDNFSPKFTLAYAAGPDVNLYGSIASGYRSGGFNPEPDNAAVERLPIPYDEETSTSYEVGLKTQPFAGATFNIAAYYLTTDDLLVLQQVVPVGGGASLNFLVNGGEGNQYGAEIDGSVRFRWDQGRSSLRLFASAAIADGEIDSLDPALDGTSLSYVRDFEGSFAATLRQALNDKDLRAFFNYSIRGGFGGFQNQAAGRDLDDIVISDLRLGLETNSWSLIGSVENLFDSFYVPQQSTPTVFRASSPRQFRLTARLNF